MGLVQREIEAAGMSTITLSPMPDWTQAMGVPRLVGVEYPLGLTVGRPGDKVMQTAVLRDTLRALVEAEREALARGASREEAIQAAYDRFYRGDIAGELVRGTREEGGLISMEDLDRWEVKIERPVRTEYRGLDVYKLTTWTQGPVMLQALNILENFDLRRMGHNSADYLHALTEAMKMAFADRAHWLGDPAFAKVPRGLVDRQYAARLARRG